MHTHNGHEKKESAKYTTNHDKHKTHLSAIQFPPCYMLILKTKITLKMCARRLTGKVGAGGLYEYAKPRHWHGNEWSHSSKLKTKQNSNASTSILFFCHTISSRARSLSLSLSLWAYGVPSRWHTCYEVYGCARSNMETSWKLSF